jgi:DnaD/phage-associated family protein
MNRDFKGIWIPKEIWLTKELTLQEKIILVEIDSLDNEERCWASNKYFAEFFGLTTQRVSKIIQNLNKKGYLKIDFVYKGKAIDKRLISINKPPYPSQFRCQQNDDTYQQNDYRVSTKCLEGYQQKFKDNNITCNNIINNIYNNNIYDYIEENFGRSLTPIEYELINTWEDNELTRYAIKQAVLNGKCNFKYINAILNSYEKNNIKTVQQAQEDELNFKNRKKQNVPDWYNQEFEEDIANDEDIKKLEERIKNR